VQCLIFFSFRVGAWCWASAAHSVLLGWSADHASLHAFPLSKDSCALLLTLLLQRAG